MIDSILDSQFLEQAVDLLANIGFTKYRYPNATSIILKAFVELNVLSTDFHGFSHFHRVNFYLNSTATVKLVHFGITSTAQIPSIGFSITYSLTFSYLFTV